MITCKYCKTEKHDEQMVPRAGKPSLVCLECKEKRGGGRASKKSTAAARAPRAAADFELSIPAGGFGVNAKLTEEGYLQLTQENDGAAPDNVCLTRFELRAVFEKFGTWAVES